MFKIKTWIQFDWDIPCHMMLLQLRIEKRDVSSMSGEASLPSELDFFMKLITADKVGFQLGISLQLSILQYSSFNFRGESVLLQLLYCICFVKLH